MLTPSLRLKALLLLLTAVLALPWPSAAAPRSEEGRQANAAEPAAAAFFARAWSFLENIWSKSACHVDPFGVCGVDPTQPPPAKSGCQIDPFGICKP